MGCQFSCTQKWPPMCQTACIRTGFFNTICPPSQIKMVISFTKQLSFTLAGSWFFINACFIFPSISFCFFKKKTIHTTGKKWSSFTKLRFCSIIFDSLTQITWMIKKLIAFLIFSVSWSPHMSFPQHNFYKNISWSQ